MTTKERKQWPWLERRLQVANDLDQRATQLAEAGRWDEANEVGGWAYCEFQICKNADLDEAETAKYEELMGELRPGSPKARVSPLNPGVLNAT